MNVSSTGKVKLNGMNVGRKPEYGTAELNINGGTVEFGRYGMNVGYAGSREGRIKLTNGGTLKSVDHDIYAYSNIGGTITEENVVTEAAALSVGVGVKGSLEVLSGSTVDVTKANIGDKGTVTVNGSTFSADSLTNKGTFTLSGGTVNVSAFTNSGAFTISGW